MNTIHAQEHLWWMYVHMHDRKRQASCMDYLHAALVYTHALEQTLDHQTTMVMKQLAVWSS